MMFEIEYMGGNNVLVSAKNKKMSIDPNREVVGLKPGKTAADIHLATEKRFAIEPAPDDVTLLEGPGEYEAGPFLIRGHAAVRHIDQESDGKNSTIYRVEIGEARIAVLGNVAAKLDEDQLETLGVVDILVIPVGGGGYTLDATSAAALCRQIEPHVVVPVHYADPGLSYEVPQDELDVFTRELGMPVEEMPKLKLKTMSALPQSMTVYKLVRN